MESVLTLILAFLIMAIMILGFVYFYMWYKEKIKNETNGTNGTDKKTTDKRTGKSEYTKLSVFNFMQFDKIEDNMIVQNNGERYLMAIECEGINYDLMSGLEKTAVEAGFVQFLNTLRSPIQIYVQTRTIKISNSIEGYKRRIDAIKQDLDQKQKNYNLLLQSGTATEKQIREAKMEFTKVNNMYTYGVDVVDDIEKISLNKNVLRKHYYIIVPYYKSELGSDLLDEEEKRSMIFSELYTRAQSIIRTLFACSLKCKILNSEELLDLLYVAYNREDSEVYGQEKAMQAGYDELYSTAPDVLDKRMLELNKRIEKEAETLAKNTVDKIKSKKQMRVEEKEKNFDELIKEMAEVLLKENKKYIGEEVAEEAIEEIKDKKTKEKGGKANEEKTKKTRNAKKSI